MSATFPSLFFARELFEGGGFYPPHTGIVSLSSAVNQMCAQTLE